MYKISLDKMNDLFSAIANTQELYAPIEKADKVEFHKWSEDEKVRLDVLNTVKSAKDAFFPQSEDLMSFKVDGQKISIEEVKEKAKKATYFGVRACDAKSFEILDKVFLVDPVDTFYKAKRECGTIVAMACSAPEETCFCSTFGIDATEPAGDVVTYIADGNLYWKSVTEKGDALTEIVKAVLTDADASDDQKVEDQKKMTKEIIEQLPFAHLDLEGFDGDHMQEKFDSPKWDELSKACIGCGTCTFVCPTCQCYDIREFDTGHGVKRFRCWDSCMYSDFTKMAAVNPRTTQLQRFRQRFMHKLVYFPANNEGTYGCVGCGRCLQKCPISMNIVKVIKAIGGKENE